MFKGEIIQLRDLIESLQGAIMGNNQESMYDFMAQAEALYSSNIPKLSEAFETAKDQSGLVMRQAQVIQQLLKQHLVRIEAQEDSKELRPDNSCEGGAPHMNAQEYKQRVYRVIVSVLKMPDASPKVLAEKCGIPVSDFYEILSFAQNEGLVSGIHFARGGQGRTPLAAFFDTAQRTMKGLEFMKQFEATGTPQLQGSERPTVFISYNQKSGNAFVDSLARDLALCATVVRDKTTMDAWESFSNFMKTIRKQDFAVMVITPDYLRSEACMFEVSEMMKDDDWQQKVMFAVLDSSIYTSGPEVYIQYWQDQEKVLYDKAKSIDAKNMSPITSSLNKVSDIQKCFGAFYKAICDSNNPPLWEIKDRIIDRIRKTTNTSFAESLDNSQYAAEKEEQIRRLLY